MSRFWPIATSVFGLASLGVLLGFSQLDAVKNAYPHGEFAEELGRFQKATDVGALNQIFGNPPRQEIVDAMSAGNTLDLYAYIPTYGLFLLCAAAFLAGGIRKPMAWLAIVPVLIGVAADVVETYTQLDITSAFDLQGDLQAAGATIILDDLTRLAPAAWTKFFALAFASIGMTAICFMSARKRWIAGMLGFIPLAAVFADFSGAVHIPSLMTLAFGAQWIAVLALAIRESFMKPARFGL